jgi:hypothetical protein
MKRLITSLALATLLFAPTAQAAELPQKYDVPAGCVTQDCITQTLINALIELIQKLTEQIATQNAILTTPAPAPVVVVPPAPQFLGAVEPEPQVQKDLIVNSECREDNVQRTYCNIYVYSLEDGKMKHGHLVTLTADDQGTFSSEGKANTNTQTTHYAGYPKPSAKGSVAGTFFQYTPEAVGPRVLTITANGVTTSVTVNGQR